MEKTVRINKALADAGITVVEQISDVQGELQKLRL